MPLARTGARIDPLASAVKEDAGACKKKVSPRRPSFRWLTLCAGLLASWPLLEGGCGGIGGSNPSSDYTNVLIFTANAGSNDISMIHADPVSGQMKFLHKYPAGKHPSFISTDGRDVFVSNQADNTISVFAISTDGNSLSFVATVPTGTSPSSMSFAQGGGTLYVACGGSNEVRVYDVSGSGALKQKAVIPTGGSPTSVVDFFERNKEGRGSFYVTNFTSNSLTLGATLSDVPSLQKNSTVSEAGGPYFATEVAGDLYTLDLSGNKMTVHHPITDSNGVPTGFDATKTKSYSTGMGPVAMAGLYLFTAKQEFYVANRISKTIGLYQQTMSPSGQFSEVAPDTPASVDAGGTINDVTTIFRVADDASLHGLVYTVNDEGSLRLYQLNQNLIPSFAQSIDTQGKNPTSIAVTNGSPLIIEDLAISSFAP
ncbi:MAG TPA: beta-propeller fold lactonase family protein, partial [Fimbriimonas sp.]|nr:beta-propeller fold lactonase family protein [Fimbriimonas sp.]